MEFFRISKETLFMMQAVVFLLAGGLHLSVEFTGGTVMELAYGQSADLAKIRQTVSALGYSDVQVQNFGTARDVMIRLPTLHKDMDKSLTSARQSEQVLAALQAVDPQVPLRRPEFVGPQVGEQ